MCEIKKQVDELQQAINKMESDKRMEKFASIIYQFVVLIAVVVLNVLAFIVNGEFNDILIGALVGVMVGLAPASNIASKVTQDKSKSEEK